MSTQPQDECSQGIHNCHLTAKCSNTVESYTCQCLQGSGNGLITTPGTPDNFQSIIGCSPSSGVEKNSQRSDSQLKTLVNANFILPKKFQKTQPFALKEPVKIPQFQPLVKKPTIEKIYKTGFSSAAVNGKNFMNLDGTPGIVFINQMPYSDVDVADEFISLKTENLPQGQHFVFVQNKAGRSNIVKFIKTSPPKATRSPTTTTRKPILLARAQAPDRNS